MIVFDLEWNRGYDKKDVDEVLQIGAVKIQRLGGPIVSQFNAYIRPLVHKKFDRGARSLPDLQESRRSELTFHEAWRDFCRWCGDDRRFAAWGEGDMAILEKECAFWNIPFRQPEAVYDVQAAFAQVMGAGRQQAALWRVVDYLGIPETFTYHNALNDALYTALVGEWLREEELTQPRPRPAGGRRSLSAMDFQAPPPRPVGPFPSRKAGMDESACRAVACPVCGRELWVSRWKRIQRGELWGVVQCGEHGRFLARLTLAPDECGRWSGWLSVPELTEEVRQEYRRVRAQGVEHLCHRSGQAGQKKRRWYSGGKKRREKP